MHNKKLFIWALTSALAGFLFGFDTVVISGAEQTIQTLWGLSAGIHGLAISMALWGTVIGSLVGGWPTEKFGRKKTLTWIGILYFVSAVGSAYAPEVYSFMIARFIGGLGVGISTVAAPLYISEIAPAKDRGKLAGMFQFNIVFGILVAFLSNALLAGIGDNAWRWMLGVEAIPALIYSVMCFGLPESPRWLITHGNDRQGGMDVFRRINPELSDVELETIADEVAASVKQVDHAEKFFTPRLMKPISLAFLIAFFNQLSGINAILYFAPRIFEMTGLEESAALLQSIGIGVTNLIFTFVGLWLIDRLGRRTLLYIGSFGYIASLGLCAWAFSTENFAIVPAFIFAFIAAHAIGQGAVIWVFISEIFPNRNRAAGQSLGSFTHWIFAALLTLFFPKMVEAFSPSIVFGFFCFMMILQLVWVKFLVPETKGVSLEDMQAKLGIK
ncbi:sugar porter family MFS transporter [Pontiella sulfatireligans]|uniref:D-xylose-proton symporter n=1 Tax=Pontiella sulfatireligans TaxID=2750658 RepID=A0A6C2UTQ6_9BACT|nr:sugar porter family MFS transporter [Pontiella sulfatireligans]VGO22671.1 D-xylose-proton symporter [Pontiella sulfatireligans]